MAKYQTNSMSCTTVSSQRMVTSTSGGLSPMPSVTSEKMRTANCTARDIAKETFCAFHGTSSSSHSDFSSSYFLHMITVRHSDCSSAFAKMASGYPSLVFDLRVLR